jgi:26S proteasome regulatory subunit N3
MAARKAPQDTGRGFSLTVQKLIVIVQLLMGDIPERSVFNLPETRAALKPYLVLTQAVRAGDLHEFSQVCLPPSGLLNLFFSHRWSKSTERFS